MTKLQSRAPRLLALFVLVSVTACGSPQARSVDYFSANPDKMKAVLEACDQQPGVTGECENARAAAEKLRANETFDRAMETSKPTRGAKPTF